MPRRSSQRSSWRMIWYGALGALGAKVLAVLTGFKFGLRWVRLSSLEKRVIDLSRSSLA